MSGEGQGERGQLFKQFRFVLEATKIEPELLFGHSTDDRPGQAAQYPLEPIQRPAHTAAFNRRDRQTRRAQALDGQRTRTNLTGELAGSYLVAWRDRLRERRLQARCAGLDRYLAIRPRPTPAS